jgi:hypothetical protein
MMRMRWVAALFLLAPLAANAVTPAQIASLRFEQEDKCIANARAAHQNRDIASQRAVDREVDKCLAAHQLPPRAHLAPDPDPAPAANDK